MATAGIWRDQWNNRKNEQSVPRQKKGKWHKRKGTWANWNFWLWLWLKNKSPLIDPRIFMNLPQFFIGPSKFNDPISFERQPSCFLQLHRFWNRVILANGTLFTHVCMYGVYIYIYTYIYTHIKTEVMLHPQIGGFPTGFKHLQSWCV